MRKYVGPALLGSTAVLAACVELKGPAEVLFWDGVLRPAPGASMALAGSVAMVAEERVTRIGIGVEGGEEGSRLGWMIRDGSCDRPGARLGPQEAFPILLVGEDGSGRSETVLQRRIPDAEGYAGEVFADPDGSGPMLACADLIRRR